MIKLKKFKGKKKLNVGKKLIKLLKNSIGPNNNLLIMTYADLANYY